MSNRRQKGFTLVQLAIVLIILGVLAGGVLATRGMIETAKIQRLAKDLQQYEAAAGLFGKTYRYLPGDAPRFFPAGNGDGIIGINEGTCENKALHWEGAQFFAHLSQAEMLDKTYVAFQPDDPCGGAHLTLYEDMAGIVAPYTELNATAAADYTGNRRKSIFNIESSALGISFGFKFAVNASYVIPLETKFGAGSTGQTIYDLDPGMCNGIYGSTYCADPNATSKILYYIFYRFHKPV